MQETHQKKRLIAVVSDVPIYEEDVKKVAISVKTHITANEIVIHLISITALIYLIRDYKSDMQDVHENNTVGQSD